MRIQKKKLQMVGLSVLFFIGMIAIPKNFVFAQHEVNGGASLPNESDVLSEREQIKEILENEQELSEEQKQDINEKMRILNEENERYSNTEDEEFYDDISPREIVYKKTLLKVKHFEQEKDYYCGPATTKQTLHYITGKSPSQDAIAKALGTTEAGTDGLMIKNYLNSKQGRVTFVVSTTTNAEMLKGRIYHDLRALNTPSIARVRFEMGGKWKYSTGGHFFNISCCKDGMTEVKIVDPYITIADKNNKTGKYYVKFSKLRKAIIDHPNHHLYW